MELAVFLDLKERKDDTYYRVVIAIASLEVITPLVFLLLHLMMLHMLVKFDQRLSPELKDKIANNLRWAFAKGNLLDENLNLEDGDDLSNQSVLQQSRKAIKRKQKVYE